MTRVLSCSSPNARHQSVASGAWAVVVVGVVSPSDSALRTVATGLMPDRSAQPVRPVAINTVAATLAALMTAMRNEACHTGKGGASPAGLRWSAGSASVRRVARGKVQDAEEEQEKREVMVSHQSMGLWMWKG